GTRANRAGSELAPHPACDRERTLAPRHASGHRERERKRLRHHEGGRERERKRKRERERLRVRQGEGERYRPVPRRLRPSGVTIPVARRRSPGVLAAQETL